MISTTASIFLNCGRVVRSALDTAEIAVRWDDHSSLERMSIGDLTAHLANAVFTVGRYLDNPDSEVTRSVETVGDYFGAALTDTDYYDGLDSDLQTAVRGRASTLAEKGAVVIIEELDTSLADLAGRFENPPERLTVLAGLSIPIDAYLESRIIEMVVHLDDLDRSLTVDLPSHSAAATELVVDRLFEMAKQHYHDKALIRAMTRPELETEISIF